MQNRDRSRAGKSHFSAMIEAAKVKIKSGDVFWAAQGKILKIGTDLDSLEFCERPCANNPSPYMFCFSTPYDPVACSGPELIMRIKKDEIFVAHRRCSQQRRECRSERDADPIRDARLKRELLSDEKELAEHQMPIDLARDDAANLPRPLLI